jgi:hypothetical protein
MSEETMIESAATAEVQAEAEKMGWIPPTRYKGDAERFVDADTFMERGETVLPIVKKQLAKEREQTASLSGKVNELAAALNKANTAIAEIEERHTVATQKAVERARSELKAQLANASSSGDHEAVAEITEQMTLLNSAETKAEVKKEEVKVEQQFQPHPEFVEWMGENPWFSKDKKRTALALATASEMRDTGDTRLGRTFFDAVVDEMEKEYPTRSKVDKVESARNGSDEGAGRGARGGKTFASLPADAKAACRADAQDFVGPTKRYKTNADWEAQYAKLYFETE